MTSPKFQISALELSSCGIYRPVTIFWPCPEVVIISDKHCIRFKEEQSQFSIGQTAQSPTCSIMEKPNTGLDDCPRILLSFFRARNSVPRHLLTAAEGDSSDNSQSQTTQTTEETSCSKVRLATLSQFSDQSHYSDLLQQGESGLG